VKSPVARQAVQYRAASSSGASKPTSGTLRGHRAGSGTYPSRVPKVQIAARTRRRVEDSLAPRLDVRRITEPTTRSDTPLRKLATEPGPHPPVMEG
jgi:hypothetical protein